MTMASIFNPVSPSNTYVVYDQFHDFNSKDHLEEAVRGWNQAVERYAFYKTMHPGYSLGLCTVEYFNHLKQSYKPCSTK